MKAKLKEPEVLVPKMREVVDYTTELSEQAQEAFLTVESTAVVIDLKSREIASAALKYVASRHDEAESKRKAWTRPLKAVAADIDANFRPGLRLLKQVETALKQLIGAFDLKQMQEASALKVKALESAKRGDLVSAEETWQAIDSVEMPTSGASTKIEWSGQVIDIDALPREYLKPDLEKLIAATRAHGGDPGIPGWSAHEVANVRTGRR